MEVIFPSLSEQLNEDEKFVEIKEKWHYLNIEEYETLQISPNKSVIRFNTEAIDINSF